MRYALAVLFPCLAAFGGYLLRPPIHGLEGVWRFQVIFVGAFVVLAIAIIRGPVRKWKRVAGGVALLFGVVLTVVFYQLQGEWTIDCSEYLPPGDPPLIIVGDSLRYTELGHTYVESFPEKTIPEIIADHKMDTSRIWHESVLSKRGHRLSLAAVPIPGLFSLGATLLVYGGLSPAPLRPRRRRVFLSYRREDTAQASGRIYDDLVQRFGEEHVFKDLYSIVAGSEWRESIRSRIRMSDVFLAVIGESWSTERLVDPEDMLRLELELARAEGKPVIPVLVDNGEMPSKEDLPDSLSWLSELQGAPLRDSDYPYDFERLVAAIGSTLSRNT